MGEISPFSFLQPPSWPLCWHPESWPAYPSNYAPPKCTHRVRAKLLPIDLRFQNCETVLAKFEIHLKGREVMWRPDRWPEQRHQHPTSPSPKRRLEDQTIKGADLFEDILLEPPVHGKIPGNNHLHERPWHLYVMWLGDGVVPQHLVGEKNC